ncbi:Hydroxypyruvate isomerase (plasmid) [Haloterrigena turkmenica DSM 5511]|uniref:Hydroxypyruvate isomerase n=1 Tax=Haloterrigena turkmenica (strain ATCC 51198 / DSM 5511 / JCM 9101 / NCIMB 13204 / VKM B-1734 / 4k) TaxID=543526 RepID=D2S1N6_HALTV|nr:TIM barrel protein [Haloterrigena turkmenica]ADB63283.1 Hydroxypyruvate isomerase [Haloterrigena turkmenica DSM 5511]
MPAVSVCVELVYDDEPFHERIARAAAAGADAVEFWDWRGKDLERLERAAAEAEIPIAGCVADGTLTDPEATDDAVETIRESIETAADLGIPTLIATSGPDQEGLDRATQRGAIVDVLSRVALDAEAADVTIALEPLNTAVDHPGNYLETSAEGLEIVDAVDSPNVRLLYDVYHQQITEGDVVRAITENVDRIGHIHVADVPGRHEPGTGELDYETVFAAIDEAGYDGYVGCEFSPVGDADEAIATVLNWR